MRLRRGVGFGWVVVACALVAAACSAESSNPTVPPYDAALPPIDSGGPRDATHDALPAVDSGSACTPGDVSMFVANWMPPIGPYTGDCTDAELTNLMADCFDMATATTTACSGWLADTTHATCVSCFLGPVTAKTWAPFVYTVNGGEAEYVNVGGCLALAAPGDAMCAEAIQALLTCDIAACVINCPIPTDDSAPDFKAAVNALNACFDAADVGGCQNLAQYAKPCAGLADAAPTSFCFAAGGGDLDALRQTFALACGANPMTSLDAGGD